MFISLNLINFHFIHRGVRIVHDIIDGPREGVDILSIQGGDECLVQFFNKDSSQFICLPFDISHEICIFLCSVLSKFPKGFETLYGLQRLARKDFKETAFAIWKRLPLFKPEYHEKPPSLS